MRISPSLRIHAFSLVEMMVAMAAGSIIFAATLTSSIALQRSFAAVDNYSATHTQQIRIVDYLARDVKRGLSVTSSVDKQTVIVRIPKYIIQAGDPEVIANPSANPSLIGTPRAPSLAVADADQNINYGSTVSSVEYKVSGSLILRTEDGIVTTIASSTDNLIPETTDVELANTEYTTTAITFKPISVADRDGTIIYSTAYLRNRRRLF